MYLGPTKIGPTNEKSGRTQNKTSNYQRIIAQIYEDRTKGFSNYDLTGIKWKQVDRQIREMMKFLVLACSAFKYDRGILSFDKSKISEEKDAEFISRLLNYNIYWSCPNVPFSIANESYSKYRVSCKSPWMP